MIINIDLGLLNDEENQNSSTFNFVKALFTGNDIQHKNYFWTDFENKDNSIEFKSFMTYT